MNLLDLMVRIGVDDQASSKVEGISSSMIAKGVAIGNAMYDAAKAVGSAVVDISSSALKATADYEQLVGGVQTLFGAGGKSLEEYAASVGKSVDDASAEYSALVRAQNTMLNNAADGFQTAGVSANRYMEITTSFSAALINSLGGDTQKAAEYANKAIIQMSDNANKMGTDIQVIQATYQSIARGNYEMLDNLKLGYGGTKAELERLLSDAEKYMAANGEMRDLSIDNFADIVDAIQVVQDNMGITGTTAFEAATTIEGSVNQAKAAWENWLTGLGGGVSDMSTLTDQLVQSVVNVMNNVIPAVGTIMLNLIDSIGMYGPQVAATLGTTLLNGFVDAFNFVSQNLSADFQIPLPTLNAESLISDIQTLFDEISSTIQGLADAYGPTFQSLLELFSALGQGVGEVLGNIWTAIQEQLVPALEAAAPYLDAFIQALIPWVEPLTNVASIIGGVFIGVLTAFINVLTFVVSVVTVVLNAIINFDTFIGQLPTFIGTAVTGIINWFSQLPGMIASFLSMVISNAISWASGMISNAASAGSGFISNVVSFLSSLPGRVAGFLGSVISTVAGWVGQMASNAAQAASRFASSLMSGLSSLPGRVLSVGSQIISGLVNGISNGASRVVSAITGVVQGAIDAAKSFLGIASPSKVFRKFGEYTMQGFSLGIQDGEELPVASMEDAMRNLENSATISVPAGSSDTVTGMSSIYDAVTSLHKDLGKIIQKNAPTATPREFARAVRSV